MKSLMLFRTIGLVAGAALVAANAWAAEADAFPTFESNYIKVSATGAALNGDKAAYQARTQTSKAGVAGIEDFNYNYDLSKDVNLDVNGKVLAGEGDYLAEFKLSKNEFGTLEAGYKRFRTFYDDVGGFFPQNNVWLPIFREPLYVDRGKFFINATLAMPKAPVFTFKYTNETRTGQKDSTIWGDSDLTGVPIMSQSSLNFFPAARKILPAYIHLGERQETWEASMTQTVGNTTYLLTVAGDRINNLDSRSIDRYIGELKPYPAIPSTPVTQVPNNFANNPNYGQDQQGFKETGYTFGGRLETVVSDQITLYGNISYHQANVDINASRLIVAPLLTSIGLVSPIGTFTSGGRSVYSYTSTGDLKQDILTANIGIQFKPVPTLYIDAALRGEAYNDKGTNDAVYVASYVAQNTGAVTPQLYPAPQTLDNTEKPWTPAVDVRYTGLPNVALYGSWDYRSVTQDEHNSSTSIGPAGTLQVVSASDGGDHIKEHHMNVKVGANWTPVTLVSARAEVFTKDHENRFSDFEAGDYYNLDYDIYGVKLTAVVKPLPTLGFTTRYIVQRGKTKVADNALGFDSSNDSGTSRRYDFGETVDWNPTKLFYLQANLNLVYDTIITSYPQVTGLAQTVVHNADTNYWNGSVVAGMPIDAQTDFQVEGFYYRANNYNPDLAFFTQPYGAGAKEYRITAGLKYKVDAKTVVAVKGGYIDSVNQTTGGYTNFRGPLAYVSVEHAF